MSHDTDSESSPDFANFRLKKITLARLYDKNGLDILDRGASRASWGSRRNKYGRWPRPTSMSTPRRCHRYLKKHETVADVQPVDYCLIYSSSVTGNAQFLECRLREEELTGVRIRLDSLFGNSGRKEAVKRAAAVICVQPASEDQSCVRVLKSMNLLPADYRRLIILESLDSSGYTLENDGRRYHGDLMTLVPEIQRLIHQNINVNIISQHEMEQVEDVCFEAESRPISPEILPPPPPASSQVPASVNQPLPASRYGSLHYILYCTASGWEKTLELDRDLQLCGFTGRIHVVPTRKPLKQMLTGGCCPPREDRVTTAAITRGLQQADVHVIAASKDFPRFTINQLDDPSRVFILAHTSRPLATFTKRRLQADCVPEENVLRLQISEDQEYDFSCEIVKPLTGRLLLRYS